jgi:archaellin
MGKSIITGIIALILLTSLMLIGITVASIITGENTGTTTEENYDQMTEEVIDEISTYIQIKDQKGKYYEINGKQRIEKIALWISPLVTQEINVSQLTIQLNNGETVMFLMYNGNAENLESSSIFGHPIWNNMDGSNFGFISIIDLDGSLVDYNTINDCSDNAYVVFKLPSDMTMLKNEKLIVTLFPSTGITRTTILEAPLPIKTVVTFE